MSVAVKSSVPRRRILDAAERLAQQRGFNGFSYADVAQQLGVTTPSLHYHFRSKADLGRALIERYAEAFAAALAAIEAATPRAPARLRRYVELYDTVLRDDRMCLCGMLAAERTTLPAAMQDALREFFDLNERWLEAVLRDGKRAGELAFGQPARERARLFLGALEGAMLVSRTYGDGEWFRRAAQVALADVGASRRGAPASPRRVGA